MRRFTIRSSVVAVVWAVILLASAGNATAYTWTIWGTADSGQWGSNDLTGRDYVMRFTATSFGGSIGGAFSTWSASTTADIQGLGSINIGTSNLFLTENPNADHDNIFANVGLPSSSTLDLNFPKGTLGDISVAVPSKWGPIQAISGGLGIFPFSGNFKLLDSVGPSSTITACAGLVSCAPGGSVPEPSSWLFLSLGLVAMAYAIRKAGPSYSL